MAEQTPLREAEPLASPAERGTLEVKTRAIQHIAEQAVRDTPGTVAHHSTLGRFVGAGTPKASITMEGARARISVDVAAVWPCDATAIATGVRDRVLTETARLSGVFIRTVDVSIEVVQPSEATDVGRRVE